MGEIYGISISEINRLALSGKKFSAEQAGIEIVKKGGILRAMMGVTLREYFQEMVYKGHFVFAGFSEDKDSNTLYLATDKFLGLAKALPDCVEKGQRIDVFESVLELKEVWSMCHILKTKQI